MPNPFSYYQWKYSWRDFEIISRDKVKNLVKGTHTLGSYDHSILILSGNSFTEIALFSVFIVQVHVHVRVHYLFMLEYFIAIEVILEKVDLANSICYCWRILCLIFNCKDFAYCILYICQYNSEQQRELKIMKSFIKTS